ncbi:prepilin-type N-terminal cleavage/methylation domain-containing protein [Methylovulum sp.]|uniref:type IV pilus modification PilV family protein n=1 Tax=Methylovulum sp. TaxID=1916980 RepID=UPI002636E9DC|nr:prepilin-type N-terminal cleavage/methylation domain-containing protein [Methylovulum sp.]
MRQAKNRQRQNGFTLLEAIVALVLLSTTGMALFGWINNTLSGLNHALDSGQKTQYRQNALALMQQINPALDKTGEFKNPAFTLTWQSTAITPLKQEIDNNGIPGSYLLGLFDSKVTILQKDNKTDEFILRQIGYQRVK